MSKRFWIDQETNEHCLSYFNQELANIFSTYFYFEQYDIPEVYDRSLPFNLGLTQEDRIRIKEQLGKIDYAETEYDPIYGLLFIRVLHFHKWNLYLRFEFQYESYERGINGMYVEQVYPVKVLQTIYQDDPNAVDDYHPSSLEPPNLLEGL